MPGERRVVARAVDDRHVGDALPVVQPGARLAGEADAVGFEHFAMDDVVHRVTDKHAGGEVRAEELVAIGGGAVAGGDVVELARIVEALDKAGASFVSVTQAFNTTNSMGRLTLNVLLSFAQFEREVTSERIRDKVAASKRKGIFMGGPVPIGYRLESRRLIVEEAEAATVRMIFERYLALCPRDAMAEEIRSRLPELRREAARLQ